MLKFSYSQINTFSNCPQKYKLIYIDKIKKPHDSIEAFLGKVVHEVLEWIYKEKMSYLIWDSIEKKYTEIWKKKWHENIYIAPIRKKLDTNHFKKMGLECLRNFYKNNQGPYINFKNVCGVELEIEFMIDEYHFKTIIDRLDKFENRYEIHDYKTGKPKTQDDLKDDLQLFIYQKAVESLYGKNKKINLNWHYLKESSKNKQHIKIIKNEDDLISHERNLLEKINQIIDARKKEYFPSNSNFLCNWCYFWEECEAKKQFNEINPSILAK